MAKTRTIYLCQSCGASSHKWLGRCAECNGWNTFAEERVIDDKKRRAVSREGAARPMPVSGISIAGPARVSTGLIEFDRVLGGGMVAGSAVLIGGDPGIGKSTLLLQAMGAFASGGGRVLYVTGEESLRQIRLRAERLGVGSENLLVYPETSVEAILSSIKEFNPGVVVIDSIQTVHTSEFDSSPGSIGQVRESAMQLITSAKTADAPLFLVGHVTKEGAIAGPKVLEHMVDTVLYFEGERGHAFRILRAVKNRYGSVMEIGVFEMKDSGLKEVTNPSEMFLSERPEGASGSAVVSSLEGSRTILVEVQSLVCPTLFGVPRRTVSGVDYNKVMLIAAVLEKKAGLSLANHDIFIKVAGGMRLEEPAVDMGVLASLASNFLDKPVDAKTVVFGEVGLAGEVRGVSHVEQRVREAEKLGFIRCILPKDNIKGLKPSGRMKLAGVTTVKEAIERLF
ncbi:MAG: DNA repair protein RadA [Deltaproteobacteria bacterium]|nr:DNA repair protein RadA [Deltaproteobacteria bacterium]